MQNDILSLISGFYIIQLLGLVGIGSFLDSVVKQEYKRDFALYINGQANAKFAEFEFQIMSNIIGLFCSETNIEKLSLRKILLYTVSTNVFLILIFLFYNNQIEPILEGVSTSSKQFGTLNIYLYLFIYIITFIFISFILDYFSFFVTKKLFFYKTYGKFVVLVIVFIDIIISFLPNIIIIITVFGLLDSLLIFTNTHDWWDTRFLTVTFIQTVVLGATMNFFGNSLISIIQIALIFSGSLLRIINPLLQKISSLFITNFCLNYPYTSCFVFLSLLIIILDFFNLLASLAQ